MIIGVFAKRLTESSGASGGQWVERWVSSDRKVFHRNTKKLLPEGLESATEIEKVRVSLWVRSSAEEMTSNFRETRMKNGAILPVVEIMIRSITRAGYYIHSLTIGNNLQVCGGEHGADPLKAGARNESAQSYTEREEGNNPKTMALMATQQLPHIFYFFILQKHFYTWAQQPAQIATSFQQKDSRVLFNQIIYHITSYMSCPYGIQPCFANRSKKTPRIFSLQPYAKQTHK